MCFSFVLGLIIFSQILETLYFFSFRTTFENIFFGFSDKKTLLYSILLISLYCLNGRYINVDILTRDLIFVFANDFKQYIKAVQQSTNVKGQKTLLLCFL